MSVEVIVGTHADDDAHRRAARDWTVARYRARGWPITVTTARLQPWRKAEAYNAAVEASSADVVILADSDSFVSSEALEWAAYAAADVGWAVPFTKVCRLTEQATAATLQLDPAEVEYPRDRALGQKAHDVLAGGGIVAMTRDLALQCGPFDPRFVGWGGEDYALGCAARTLAGDYPASRRGPLWHLWHPPQPRTAELDEATNRLGFRYRVAKFQPDAMRALIAEWRS